MVLGVVSQNVSAQSEFMTILDKYTNSPVEIDFEQKTYWNVREKETKVKGKIILGQNNNFNISVGKMNYISNSDTFWEYNSRQKQVIIRKISPQLSKSIPTELLKLIKSANFVENKSAKSVVWQDSQSLENGYEKVEAFFANQQISKIIINDTEKNITTYIFEKTVFLSNVSPDTFNFVIPEGTQIHED
jgi:outer membrane lipoprotein-sorting protein